MIPMAHYSINSKFSIEVYILVFILLVAIGWGTLCHLSPGEPVFNNLHLIGQGWVNGMQLFPLLLLLRAFVWSIPVEPSCDGNTNKENDCSAIRAPMGGFLAHSHYPWVSPLGRSSCAISVSPTQVCNPNMADVLFGQCQYIKN